MNGRYQIAEPAQPCNPADAYGSADLDTLGDLLTKPMKFPQQLPFLASLIFFAPAAYGAESSCGDDLDSCVRRVIAETAVFFDECGKVYPKNKSEIDAAFQAWPVLRLPIPEIQEALDEKSQLRKTMLDAIGPYFKRIPGYEKEIECLGRLEMVRNPVPTLQGDSAKLPANALAKYGTAK